MPGLSRKSILCITMLWLLPVACLANSKSVTVLKLVQWSKVAGNETVYLGPEQIRVENCMSSVITIAKAPDWKICRFNPHSKLFIEIPYSQFTNKLSAGQVLAGSVILDRATVKKTGITKFLKFGAETYTSSSAFETNAFDLRHRLHSVTGSFPQRFEMIALPVSSCPAPEAHIVSVLRGSPDVGALALEITCHAFDMTTYKYVSTKDITKVSADALLFMPPSGYKRVKTESELVFDVNSNKDILNLIR
jgi:hypothetical protein